MAEADVVAGSSVVSLVAAIVGRKNNINYCAGVASGAAASPLDPNV